MPTTIDDRTADWIIRSLIRDLEAEIAEGSASPASALTPEDLLFFPWLPAVERVVASGDPVDLDGLGSLVLSLLASDDPHHYMFGAWLGRAVPGSDEVTDAIAARFRAEQNTDQQLGLFHQLTARVPAGHPLRDQLVEWAAAHAADLIAEQKRTFPGESADDLCERMARYPAKAWVYMYSAHVLATAEERRAFLEPYTADADTAVASAATTSLECV